MLKIDFWNIAFTVINILVLYVFLKHFLLAPVKKILEERKAIIERDLDAASAAKTEADRLKKEYETSLRLAGEEASKIVEEARIKGQSEYDRIMEQANRDAARQKERAGKAIAQERERAMEELKLSTAELALSAAEKLLGKQSKAEKDRQLYDAFLGESGDCHD